MYTVLYTVQLYNEIIKKKEKENKIQIDLMGRFFHPPFSLLLFISLQCGLQGQPVCSVPVEGVAPTQRTQHAPHILFILVDDLGFDDLSLYQRDTPLGVQYSTPNIDALAARGITLGRYYVQPLCSPSRAALMTGKYPSVLGLAAGVILNGAPMALDLTETILPQQLRQGGYESHLFGKCK